MGEAPKERVSATPTIGRCGGDEIAVLMPESDFMEEKDGSEEEWAVYQDITEYPRFGVEQARAAEIDPQGLYQSFSRIAVPRREPSDHEKAGEYVYI